MDVFVILTTRWDKSTIKSLPKLICGKINKYGNETPAVAAIVGPPLNLLGSSRSAWSVASGARLWCHRDRCLAMEFPRFRRGFDCRLMLLSLLFVSVFSCFPGFVCLSLIFRVNCCSDWRPRSNAAVLFSAKRRDLGTRVWKMGSRESLARFLRRRWFQSDSWVIIQGLMWFSCFSIPSLICESILEKNP